MTARRTVDVAVSTTGLNAQGRPQRVPIAVDSAGNAVTVRHAAIH